MPAPTPSKALLLGSINVKDNKEAFTTAAQTLGTKLRYFPDGETGHRLTWASHQFEKIPERIRRKAYELSSEEIEPIKLDPPLTIDEFQPTKYDVEAIASYKVFCELREQNLIKPGQKFQVCIPSPVNIIRSCIQSRNTLEAEPIVESRIAEALHAIQEAIPAQDLCIQWDMPVEIMFLEHHRLEGQWRIALTPYFEGDILEGLTSRLARISAHVQPEVELGIHLCYGDFKHKHFIDPEDAGVLTTFMNATAEKVASVHKIAYFHIPVPKERDDAAYFEPLKNLKFDGDLYLGVVQEADEEGSRRRLKAAQAVLDRDFGVSTECGLGRVPEDKVEATMRVMNDLTIG